MPILVTNSTDQALTLHSYCGDSVTVPPKARSVRIKSKFNWQVPQGILIVKDLGPDVVPVQVADPVVPVAPMPIPAPAGAKLVEEPKK